MGVSYLISQWEYLRTDYQPDCESGILIEPQRGNNRTWLVSDEVGRLLLQPAETMGNLGIPRNACPDSRAPGF
jgi:hypothetical protein